MSFVRAVRLRLSGIVQGVGFRPFVYRVAHRVGVAGYVRNIGGSGVEIHVEGRSEEVDEFLRVLMMEKPENARIDSLQSEEVAPIGLRGFQIRESDASTQHRSIIPPDFSICRDCLNEILSESRWKHYPFNSCAFCGPRYSMLYSIPYDRANTSMHAFPLCPQCRAEYEDPLNDRRFHAQGISCPACGPRTRLYTARGELVLDGLEAVREASRLLDEGFIVAVKGLGGYHIAASAVDDLVVARLRERKRRPTKPFAVMVLDLDVAGSLVELSPEASAVLDSPEKPIMLLPRRDGAQVSSLVAPNLKKLGVFLPYTALHHLLLKWTREKYSIMTSGNPHNEPMCTKDEEAFSRLSEIVDYFLTHNREIVNRVDDSVVRFSGGRIAMLRRGRGYAPRWIQLPFRSKKNVVAFGAMLQSAGAVCFEDNVILTQFIGDVDEYASFLELEKYLSFLVRTYNIQLNTSLHASDLHPQYPSTLLAEEWAQRNGGELMRIQHHWAHIAAVIAEYGLQEEEVVGIAIDGVGFGSDGSAWGGEVLIAGLREFRRVGCLRPQPMPGGDLAVEYPVRMLAGILSSGLGREQLAEVFRELGITEKGLRRGWAEFEFVLKQLDGSPPLTSSTGRVLDAASSMLGFCHRRTYEGEPAIVLEDNSRPTSERIRPKIVEGEIAILDTTTILLEALERLRNGESRSEVGYMVQHALGYGLGLIARRVAGKRRFVTVSGGAAVNDYLLEGIREALTGSSLETLLPTQAPAGDGGIALGQAAIAAYRSLSD